MTDDRTTKLKAIVAEAYRNARDGDYLPPGTPLMDIARDMIACDVEVIGMALAGEDGDDDYDALAAEIVAILPTVLEEHDASTRDR